MKLTKQKLNQLIKEVIEEYNVDIGGMPNQLRTVEEIKNALQELLDNWTSEEEDAVQYDQQLQDVVDKIEDAPATGDVEFG